MPQPNISQSVEFYTLPNPRQQFSSFLPYIFPHPRFSYFLIPPPISYLLLSSQLRSRCGSPAYLYCRRCLRRALRAGNTFCLLPGPPGLSPDSCLRLLTPDFSISTILFHAFACQKFPPQTHLPPTSNHDSVAPSEANYPQDSRPGYRLTGPVFRHISHNLPQPIPPHP